MTPRYIILLLMLHVAGSAQTGSVVANASPGVGTGTNTTNTGIGVYLTNTVNGLLDYAANPYLVNEGQVWEQDVFGPGSNTGFPGSCCGLLDPTDTGITSNHGIRIEDNSRRMGISQTMLFNENSHHGGDTFGQYWYGNVRTGWNHPADEGFSMFKINGSQATSYPIGTVITTSGRGDRSPVLSMKDLAPESFLIDTSRTVATGTITAYATTQYATGQQGGIWLQPVSSALTPSNICVTTAAIHLQKPYGSPSNSVVGCTNSQGTISAGVGWMVSLYPVSVEQCNATAVSGSNITVSCLRSHSTGSYFFQGGTSGLLSLDPEAAAGWKTTVYAFGAADVSHLITGVVQGGSWGSTWPNNGYTMSGVGSNFHLYPGAEVVQVGDQYGTLAFLGYNNVPWAQNDAVENPNYPSQLDQLFSIEASVRSPALPGSGAAAFRVGAYGEGVNAAYDMFSVSNDQSYSTYLGGGGQITAPSGLRVSGPTSTTLYASIPLGGALGYNCGTTPSFLCYDFSSYAGKVDLFRFRDRFNFFGFDRGANRWYAQGGMDLSADLTASKITVPNQPLRYAGMFTTTAATSDTISVPGLTTNSYCIAQQMGNGSPINPQPAWPPAMGSQTIYHAATAGIIVIVSCNLP